jgi:hypothetical protein
MDNWLCLRCGKPNHFAKDYNSQGNLTPKPQSELPKSQPAANQSIKQGRWQKKTCFQAATTQDEDNQSDSQDKELADAEQSPKN